MSVCIDGERLGPDLATHTGTARVGKRINELQLSEFFLPKRSAINNLAILYYHNYPALY
jgi:hypothetical protein